MEPGMSWAAYLEKRERDRKGLDIPPSWVPSTFLAAEADGRLVGRVSIRHELNAKLIEIGGHIGYGVRPQFRRRAHAKEILRQALVVARSLGVEDVLVTCDADNVASSTVIERLGGVLEDVRPDPDGPPKRRAGSPERRERLAWVEPTRGVARLSPRCSSYGSGCASTSLRSCA
jgi:predicted acetyltransferase